MFCFFLTTENSPKLPGDFDPVTGCQEAVDTAAALILQRHWRRRQRLMDLKAGRLGAA